MKKLIKSIKNHYHIKKFGYPTADAIIRACWFYYNPPEKSAMRMYLNQYSEGKSIAEIASKHKVSRERVKQTLNKVYYNALQEHKKIGKILKLKAFIYRTTGIFLAYKEQYYYMDSYEFWNELSQSKDPTISQRNKAGILIGMWQCKIGFYRRYRPTNKFILKLKYSIKKFFKK